MTGLDFMLMAPIQIQKQLMGMTLVQKFWTDQLFFFYLKINLFWFWTDDSFFLFGDQIISVWNEQFTLYIKYYKQTCMNTNKLEINWYFCAKKYVDKTNFSNILTHPLWQYSVRFWLFFDIYFVIHSYMGICSNR